MKWRLLLVFTLGGGAGLLLGRPVSSDPPAPAPPAVDGPRFARDVQTALARCVQCHGPSKARGGLRLDTREGAIAALDSGHQAVAPGKPEQSELLRRVRSTDPKLRMPPKGEPLRPDEIETLSRWIANGADWPPHWAYRPLIRPTVPAVVSSTWPRTPIDAFLAEPLRAQGLVPAPEADRRTLIRRISFDLIGLPPRPEDVDAFLADDAPDAYERVVDRLLASPHYGEHWGRHWLDVVQYADTHGHDHDWYRPNAWPYRDYVIRAFNDDKPYARFLLEQVAGDVLFPDDPQATVALGFLAAGPWDHTLLSTVREDTVDHRNGRNLDRDNIVSTVMSTFTSMTVHCARCHDHKFDPISQREYYALQAVFAGIDRADRPYDADPQTTARRQTLVARKKALAAPSAEVLASLDSAEVAAKVARAAASLGPVQWQLLDPSSVVSKDAPGTVFTKQDDGSWFVSGARPDKDTFTITARTMLQGVRGFRLEVLPDKRLPQSGPGRYDNGNFHLSQFRATARPASGAPNSDVRLTMVRAAADHSDADDVVAHALTGGPGKYWSIHPRYNQAHDAIFELQAPAGFEGGTDLTIALDFHGKPGHQVGRFRLWATTQALPAAILPAAPVAPALADKLRVPLDRQTPEQRRELALVVLSLEIDQELAALPPPQMVYAATRDFTPSGSFKPSARPRPIHLLKRGEITKPGEEIPPGTLSCVPMLPGTLTITDPGDESLRRAALARWLADEKNVLVWRSVVNRVWHYHFGKGLCNSPNDFGKMGDVPSHPELLDWLAVWFRDDAKGSLKALHRLIVTSAAYRQMSTNPSAAARGMQIDADNRLLWKMNRTRLTAEMIRDSVLQMSGRLDPKMGGPSVVQFKHKGPGETFMPLSGAPPFLDYERFDPDAPENSRRAVYRFLFRTVPDPLMAAFDCPDGGATTPVRGDSATAVQALAMLNNALVIRQCEHLAARIARESTEPDNQVVALFRLALQRPPTERERKAFVAYSRRHGLANACQMLLNTNEYFYVD